MTRTELGTKYLKNKISISLKAYNKQMNFCGKLYEKERKKDYDKLNMNNITRNQEFWKSIKQPLSDKVTVDTKKSLNAKGKFLSSEKKVAEIYSNVFENAVQMKMVGCFERGSDFYQEVDCSFYIKN